MVYGVVQMYSLILSFGGLLMITTKCQIFVRFKSCKQAVAVLVYGENKTQLFMTTALNTEREIIRILDDLTQLAHTTET